MKKLRILVLAWIIGPMVSFGAQIIWSRPLDIRDELDIINFLPLIEAWNVGSENSVTVNGILFEEPSVSLFNMWATYTEFLPATVSTPANPAYRELLSSGNFADGAIFFGNLVPGQTYTVQIWVSDGRDIVAPHKRRTVLYTENGPKVQLKENTNDQNRPGQYVIGTFTADTPTQTIFFYGISNGKKEDKTAVINAIALYKGRVADF